MKWAGYQMPRAEWVREIGNLCDFQLKTGTSCQGISDALREIEQLDFVEYVNRPTLKWLDGMIHKECGLILKFEHDHKPAGHFIFVPGRTQYYYDVVNKAGKSHSRIHRKTMSKLLGQKGKRNLLVYSNGWAVRPND